jgi:Skp family chaperone for outer membrane proteins
MKNILIVSAAAASALLPTAATAQALPAAIVAVVDVDRVRATCNACKTAISALQSQAAAEDAREKALVAPLQTEQQAIQAAVAALKGKDADAALQARAKAFQTKYEQAQEQAQRGQQQLRANQQYILKQIDEKMGPIFAQVMQRRGANVMVEQGATLAAASAIDVTNDVLTALNTALTTIQPVAPAPARTNTTQGR